MGIFQCKEEDSVYRESYQRCGKIANANTCNPCSKAIELDSLIAQTRRNLDNLLFQRQNLHTEINNIHDPIIHHLPPEVSATIFYFSLSEAVHPSFLETKRPDTSNRLATTPLSLGAVCHAWRNIVWGTPYLWTMISIPVGHRSDFEFLDTPREWLSRSGQLPLSVRLYAPRAASGGFFQHLRARLSELIHQYLPRCYALEFSCPIGLLPSISGSAPILEMLKITSDEDQDHTRPMKLYSTRSQGIRISLTGYKLNSLDLPFGNLSTFEGSFTLAECLSMFQKSRKLQECRILGINGPPSSAAQFSSPVIHGCLEKLALYSERLSSSFVLQMVQLPSLTHLTASDINPSSIHSFVLRSCCNLRYLWLESLCCGVIELCDLLHSTSSLEELHLVAYNAWYFQPDTFFKNLAQTPTIRTHGNSTLSAGYPHFLPNLSVLIIKFCEEIRFPWDLAAEIFGSLDDLRDPLRRPITEFQVVYDWRIGNSKHMHEEIWGVNDPMGPASLLLDEDVTRRFLDIAHEGVNINLYDIYAKDDILRLAMTHHNIDVPEWYTIKESVGLSDLEISGVDSDCSSDSEAELAGSEDDSESSNEEFEDNDADSVLSSDASDASYDPDYELPSHITGTIMDIL